MSEQTNPMALFAEAFAKAQGEYDPVSRNRTGHDFDENGQPVTYQYADLEEIIAATRPALAANGLCFLQRVSVVPGSNGLHLITEVMHSGGGSISSVVPITAPQNFASLKQYGMEQTYLRRYTAEAILGVAPYAEGDDIDARKSANSGAKKQAAWVKNARSVGRGDYEDYAEVMASEEIKEGAPVSFARECYTDQEFDEKFGEWQDLIIAEGMDKDDLIFMIESKKDLTDSQREKINNIGA